MVESKEQKSSGGGGGNPPTLDRKKWFYENVVSLGLALLIVFMIRSSIVEAFKIPSGSMIPTLHVGDHIFVNKFAYGLKVPFSDWSDSGPIYLLKRDPPKKGDIIVFKYPRPGENVYYIKRVVGVPGDTIEVKERVLYVNGKPVTLERVPNDKMLSMLGSIPEEEQYTSSDLELYVEDLVGEKHWAMTDKSNQFARNFNQITVPDGSYFAMGDNRDHSNDSRWWGFVPEQNIRGKAMVIWLSVWVDLGKDDFRFNPSRIGTILHKAPTP
jgi:signal peptidase I